MNDLKLAYKLYNARHNQFGKYFNWWWIIIGIVLAFMAVKGRNTFDSLVLFCATIAIGSFFIWNRYTAAQKGLKINPDILSEETLIITDEELESQTDGCITKMKWHAFIDAIVSEQMILLYTTKATFLAYPKRFLSEEEFAFLKNRASHITAKNQSKKPDRYRDSR